MRVIFIFGMAASARGVAANPAADVAAIAFRRALRFIV
jgi:hypothetical protein